MDEQADSFQNLKLKDTYSSQYDDLVDDFYNPVLEKSVKYDRVTGFFSPKVLAAAARGFSHFVKNNGKIRLVTSIEVDPEVYRTISDGLLDEKIVNIDGWDIDNIENEMVKDYLGVFSYLLKNGNLEIKIAVVPEDHGIFHEKVGIVTDKFGNEISFSGSNNETVHGWLYNIEKYFVFDNWNARSMSYFESNKKEFEDLWYNQSEGIKILPLADAFKEKVVKKMARSDDIKVVVERLKKREGQNITIGDGESEHKRKLRDYQEEAIEHWREHGYVSIFEMATGTGKTFTTASALAKFREDKKFLRALIAVPLTTLAVQWQDTIKDTFDDVVIVNTVVDTNWKAKVDKLLDLKEMGVSKDLVFITTYSMFNRKDIVEQIEPLMDEGAILIADEMHNLVTKRGIKSVKSGIYKYKLGLSATPNRLWKPNESKILMGLFGDNNFEFTLKEAIDREYLVPYNYVPLEVELTPDEWDEFLRISKKIGHILAGQSPKNIDDDDARAEDLKKMMRRRAHIKKNAKNKLDVLRNSLENLREQDCLDHALVYADNDNYLSDLQRMLTDEKIMTSRIVGGVPLKERLGIIDSLRTGSIDAIVAIKCLDEGVDIPSAKRAFILSNNTDPREYVQRLGRVLRLDPESNKDHADVYDFIVTPPGGILFEDEKEQGIARRMLKNEFVRSKFFADFALNKETVKEKMFEIGDQFGFVYRDEELCYNDNNNEE